MNVQTAVVIIIVVILILVVVIQFLAARRTNRSLSKYHREVFEDTESSDDDEPKIVKTGVTEVTEFDFMQANHPRPSTVPTFERPANNKNHFSNLDDAGYRFQVSSFDKSRFEVESSKLPKNFSAITQWGGLISGVFDQERCGSCAFHATASCLTDRIRIASKGKNLSNGDYISPFHFAACMKCGTQNACPRVCEGSYLDDVFQYTVDHGAVAQSDIEKYSQVGTEYMCFDYAAKGVAPWKAKSKYRVNIFPPSMLNDKNNLKLNEYAIMKDIYENGPVGAIFRIYVPLDTRNFYLHKSGVYGHGWKSEPTATDGYHAIAIIGWGEDEIAKDQEGKPVKYWIIRNSWGVNWADSGGFARILRGQNLGHIEADVWGLKI